MLKSLAVVMALGLGIASPVLAAAEARSIWLPRMGGEGPRFHMEAPHPQGVFSRAPLVFPRSQSVYPRTQMVYPRTQMSYMRRDMDFRRHRFGHRHFFPGTFYYGPSIVYNDSYAYDYGPGPCYWLGLRARQTGSRYWYRRWHACRLEFYGVY